MRLSLVLCVVVCVALLAAWNGTATAAQVPEATLAQLGLDGMRPMSDAQGMSIRGNGFAFVRGGSFALMTFGTPYLNVSGPGVPNAYQTGATVAFSSWGGVVASAGGWATAYAR